MADKSIAVAIILSAYDKMSRVVSSATSAAIKKFNEVKKASDAFAKNSFDTGKKAGVIGLGLAAILAMPLKAAADMQKMQISLTTSFKGNEAAAKSAFTTINSFAAKTPYSMEEVLTSFIKLKNLGLDPSENSLRAYGNTASSMGKSLDQMIEAVADASTFEFERLKEFGIKANQQGNQVKFTFQGIQTTVAKNSSAIQQYLLKIGNTNFAGGIDRQSASVYGQLSTLQDNVKMTAATIGATLIPKLNQLFKIIGPIVQKMSDWAANNPELSSTILLIVAGAAALSLTISGLSFVFGGLSTAVSIFSSTAIISSKVIQALSFGLFRIRFAFATSLLPSIWAAITATWAWTAALLANPVTWIVLAVVALAAAFVIAYQKCDGFRAAMDGVVEVAKVAIDYYGGLWKIIVGILSLDFGKIQEGFNQSSNAVKQIYSGSAFNKGYDASMAKSKVDAAAEAQQNGIAATQKTSPNSGRFPGIAPTAPAPLSKIATNKTVSNNSNYNVSIKVDGAGANATQIGDTISDRMNKLMKEFEEGKKRTNYAMS